MVAFWAFLFGLLGLHFGLLGLHFGFLGLLVLLLVFSFSYYLLKLHRGVSFTRGVSFGSGGGILYIFLSITGKAKP